MNKKKVWGYIMVVFGCLTIFTIIITEVLDKFEEPIRTRIGLGITVVVIMLILIGLGLLSSAEEDKKNESLGG